MLRVVDANLNRIGEGLRVLEDITRFILNDTAITERLKSLRHELLPQDRITVTRLLGDRDAGDDVGASLNQAAESQRPDMVSVVTANARRVQQSLRVIEEIGKVPGHELCLDWPKFKEARFAVYSLEQQISGRLLRRSVAERVNGLYVILDTQVLKGRDEIEAACQAIEGGARVIQLRDKQRDKGQLLPIALALKKLCAGSGIIFIINDDVDLALAAGADGVHLGQADLPVMAARKMLSLDKVIGCSTATVAEALKAQQQGADYIAVGSIYPTTSKTRTRLAGLETLRQVKAALVTPLVAIGGINETNVAEVVAAGADAVAVISAVLSANGVAEASRGLVRKIDESRGKVI